MDQNVATGKSICILHIVQPTCVTPHVINSKYLISSWLLWLKMGREAFLNRANQEKKCESQILSYVKHGFLPIFERAEFNSTRTNSQVPTTPTSSETSPRATQENVPCLTVNAHATNTVNTG